jgi:DNA-directed RNA polymerase alpha subunit
MQIEIKKLTEEEIYFSITNINLGIANGIRRIIIAEVPTFAIDQVLIFKNTSIMNNDYIIQRLNLLPINSNDRILIKNMPIECKCVEKQCNECSIILNVDINSCDHKKRIYLTDLLSSKELSLFTKDAFQIPLFVLNANEIFKAKLIIHKGIGHQHAKWMPATSVIVKPYPEISLEKNIFQLTNNKDELKLQDPNLCIYCNACTNLDASLVSIKPQLNKFIIHIESCGTLLPNVIFTEALQILKQKAADLNEKN